MTAPNFCMLLRKHLQNGRIVNISQPGLERIVHIDIEHLDEMGDLRHKTLVMELMGKHSNLIFCNDDNTIIDSIKRVSAAVSSVREVLPGKPYFIAHTQDKLDALTCDETTFRETLAAKPQSVLRLVVGAGKQLLILRQVRGVRTVPQLLAVDGCHQLIIGAFCQCAGKQQEQGQQQGS